AHAGRGSVQSIDGRAGIVTDRGPGARSVAHARGGAALDPAVRRHLSPELRRGHRVAGETGELELQIGLLDRRGIDEELLLRPVVSVWDGAVHVGVCHWCERSHRSRLSRGVANLVRVSGVADGVPGAHPVTVRGAGGEPCIRVRGDARADGGYLAVGACPHPALDGETGLVRAVVRPGKL